MVVIIHRTLFRKILWIISPRIFRLGYRVGHELPHMAVNVGYLWQSAVLIVACFDWTDCGYGAYLWLFL